MTAPGPPSVHPGQEGDMRSHGRPRELRCHVQITCPTSSIFFSNALVGLFFALSPQRSLFVPSCFSRLGVRVLSRYALRPAERAAPSFERRAFSVAPEFMRTLEEANGAHSVKRHTAPHFLPLKNTPARTDTSSAVCGAPSRFATSPGAHPRRNATTRERAATIASRLYLRSFYCAFTLWLPS